jgi:hypothetical protein
MNWIMYVFGGILGYFLVFRYFMLPTGMEPYENLTEAKCNKVRIHNIFMCSLLWWPVWIWICVKFISKI